jgi:hypothetical protein
VTYRLGGKDHENIKSAVVRRDHAKTWLVAEPFDRAGGASESKSRHRAEGKGDLKKMHFGVDFGLGGGMVCSLDESHIRDRIQGQRETTKTTTEHPAIEIKTNEIAT